MVGIVLLVLRHDHRIRRRSDALMEHVSNVCDHTLENIGIILLRGWAPVTGIALEQSALCALGLVGGLSHLI